MSYILINKIILNNTLNEYVSFRVQLDQNKT